MRKIISVLLATGGLFSGTYAVASEPIVPVEDDKGIFSIVFENDVFANTDHDYTDGVRVSWLSSEANAPDWVKWASNHFLPLALDGNKHLSIAAGQSMYTPTDLTTHTPILNDRPYAGWLYGSVGVVADTGNTLNSLMLTLGIVGLYSLAGDTQKFIHAHITASPNPQGWNNQIKTEPGFILTYEKKWRNLYQLSPFGVGIDVTPQVGVNLGNIETDAMTGGTIRLGYDLPADYGPPRVRPSLPGSDYFIPSQQLGGYLFAGIEGRAVARNIFLDGNTFATSQHVTKDPFVGSVQMGAAMTYGEARISYTHVFLTREFEEQKAPEKFGVVTVSYRF